jgi:hypothetical protein
MKIFAVFSTLLFLFMAICFYTDFYKKNIEKIKGIKFISIKSLIFSSVNGEIAYSAILVISLPFYLNSHDVFFEKMNNIVIVCMCIGFFILFFLINEIIKLIIRKIIIKADKKKTKL